MVLRSCLRAREKEMRVDASRTQPAEWLRVQRVAVEDMTCSIAHTISPSCLSLAASILFGSYGFGL